MRKSKNNPPVRQAPAVGRRTAKALIVLALALLLGMLAVVGQQQQEGAMAKKDVPVTDRFEKAVKAKEPKFKIGNTLRRKNEKENYVLQGWKAGDDEFVSASTYELASAEEAAAVLQSNITAPMSVPVQTIKVTRLGDEAYMRMNKAYGKEGETDLLFRKGNVVLIISASSPGVAKRFAKHMAEEIGN
jgi:hypothetical protein